MNHNKTNIRDFKCLFLWTLKKLTSIIIAYSIVLFMAFPLEYIMSYALFSVDIGTSSEDILEFAKYDVGISFPIIGVIFSLIIVLIAFNYLHGKKSADFFGSMPVNKYVLFFSRLAASIVATIVPIIVMVTITMLLDHSSAMCLTLLPIMGKIILALIFNVTLTSIICLCCGTLANSIITYLLVNGLIPFLVLAVVFFPSAVLQGFSGSIIPNDFVLLVSTAVTPMVSSIACIFSEQPYYYLIWWALVIVASPFIEYFALSKRKSETAQTAFSFSFLEPIITLISDIICGLMFGWLCAALAIETNQILWFIIGTLIGAGVCHFIMYIIRHLSLEGLKKSLIYYGISVGVVILLFSVLASGFFGYETRVPEAEEVESIDIYCPPAMFSDSDLLYANKQNSREIEDHINEGFLNIPHVEDRETITNIIDTHQKIVDCIENEEYTSLPNKQLAIIDIPNNFNSGKYLVITYNLKNGTTMKRMYSHCIGKNLLNEEKVKESFSKIEKLLVSKTSACNIMPEETSKYIAFLPSTKKLKSGAVVSRPYLETAFAPTIADLDPHWWSVISLSYNSQNMNYELLDLLRKTVNDDPSIMTHKKKRACRESNEKYYVVQALYNSSPYEHSVYDLVQDVYYIDKTNTELYNYLAKCEAEKFKLN